MGMNNNTGTLYRPQSRAEVLNAFMRGVYNWMALGLLFTGIVSFAMVAYGIGAFNLASLRGGLSGAGKIIFFGSIILELGMVFYLSSRLNRLSGEVATGVFLAYSAVNGISLSFIVFFAPVSSVAQAFITAAGMFAAMSIYGMVTKKDLTSMGSFMMMGVFGLLIASVVNMFIGSTMMHMVISVIGVVVFLGLTAYDTQMLKEMGETTPEGDALAIRRATIYGALHLYLDFINLFIMLLRLFSNRE